MKFEPILLADQRYPYLLRNIYDPPALFYITGNFPDFNLHPPIAVVGSRKPTDYGRNMAYELAASLAGAGFTIISGLAYGIDSIAHKACLEKGGITIAVMGNGPGQIYPNAHKKLAENMVEGGGAVITEFEEGMPALPQNFPRRNRIISGMSLGVIVVEAAIDSGTLITARLAMEQGREVFAVPGLAGNVNTCGTHRLIRTGAALIETAQDVIDILEPKLSTEWKSKFSGQSFGIGDRERKLLDMLGNEPIAIDNLAEKSGLAISDILIAVTTLECNNLIKEINGRGYVRNKRCIAL